MLHVVKNIVINECFSCILYLVCFYILKIFFKNKKNYVNFFLLDILIG
jgi:hypothetical protein